MPDGDRPVPPGQLREGRQVPSGALLGEQTGRRPSHHLRGRVPQKEFRARVPAGHDAVVVNGGVRGTRLVGPVGGWPPGSLPVAAGHSRTAHQFSPLFRHPRHSSPLLYDRNFTLCVMRTAWPPSLAEVRASPALATRSTPHLRSAASLGTRTDPPAVSWSRPRGSRIAPSARRLEVTAARVPSAAGAPAPAGTLTTRRRVDRQHPRDAVWRPGERTARKPTRRRSRPSAPRSPAAPRIVLPSRPPLTCRATEPSPHGRATGRTDPGRSGGCADPASTGQHHTTGAVGLAVAE